MRPRRCISLHVMHPTSSTYNIGMVPDLPPPRNRLSIAHLMLWTLGSAIILAGFRVFTNQPQQDQGRLGTILSVFYLAYCLPLGAQVGSIAIWALQRWK